MHFHNFRFIINYQYATNNIDNGQFHLLKLYVSNYYPQFSRNLLCFIRWKSPLFEIILKETRKGEPPHDNDDMICDVPFFKVGTIGILHCT